MFYKGKTAAVCAAVGAGSLAQAIFLDPGNEQSVRDVAAQIAGDTMRNFYINAPIQGIGQLPKPYYWWEAGAMFGSMVTYSAYTGDNSLNDVVGYAILSQVSPTVDFMPEEQHYDLGNDDQVVWALTAMEAAEHNFPIPKANQSKYGSDTWITAAKNAFNDISKRWDTSTCDGGLRWQIYPENSGYTYKSAISNAGIFQLASRLARFTGDSDGQYNAFATKVYGWMTKIGMVITNGNDGMVVFDGATTTSNCKDVDQHRWTYNAGSMFLGATYLASLDKNKNEWATTAQAFFRGIQSTFLNDKTLPNVMYELICEPYGTCNTDQLAFKALMMRWFNKASQVSEPGYITAAIKYYTTNSALRAAGQCSGGNSGTLCGTKWLQFGWDGTSGVGQQISALEAVQGLLASKSKLASSSSGGKREAEPEPVARQGLTARDYMEMSDAQRLKM